MFKACSNSGIACIGEVPWGTHFCQFYDTRDDLIDSLVSYFKAGLENNEQCLWVTSGPLKSDDARSALHNAVSDLDDRVSRGQIEIINHDEWYIRHGALDTHNVLQGWVKTQTQALERGFRGLRLTGNTYFVGRGEWEPFEKYESMVSDTFKPFQIIALCSYCLERIHPRGILDVVHNHQFAVVRRAGRWDIIESAALKTTKQELHQLNQDLEIRVSKRTQELEQLLKMRDEFLSIASHELKTPLASLKLQIDGILRTQSKKAVTLDQINQRLKKAEIQCRRIDLLVTSLLDISRASSGQIPIKLEWVDLSELAQEVVERFKDSLEISGNTLHLSIPKPVVGNWDRMRLDQILTNLIANAIKHAPGSTIEVEIIQKINSSILCVRDNGQGIAISDQSRIFDRFVRLEDNNTDGFGLGLWLVKNIIHRLSGTIQVSSNLGEGTVFTIELPQEPLLKKVG